VSEASTFPNVRLCEGFTTPDFEEYNERIAILMADGMEEQEAKIVASEMIKKRHDRERNRW
jgi:uncharacterized protein YoaH (UPF0181 family)